jgi:hypothetical protein
MALNIAKIDSLRTVYTRSNHPCPPIGSLTNAAMVLRDCIILRHALARLCDCARAESYGSRNLDGLFVSGSDSVKQLDLFIYFSSMSSVIEIIG